MKWNRHGQVTAESAVLFAFVIGGFVAMGFYLQRAAQGSTKANTDALGSQFSTNSPWNSMTASESYERKEGTAGTKTTSTSCSTGSHGVGVALGSLDTLPADCDAEDWATAPDPAETILRAPGT